jgi:hypothetical protein
LMGQAAIVKALQQLLAPHTTPHQADRARRSAFLRNLSVSGLNRPDSSSEQTDTMLRSAIHLRRPASQTPRPLVPGEPRRQPLPDGEERRAPACHAVAVVGEARLKAVGGPTGSRVSEP